MTFSTKPEPTLLTTKEAAHLLRLCNRTLEKHCCYGTGPAYRKLGGRVFYAVSDLQAWIDGGLRNSTSDPVAKPILPAKAHSAQAPRYQQDRLTTGGSRNEC